MGAIDGVLDGLTRRHDRSQVRTGQGADVIDGNHVGRIGHGYDKAPVVPANGHRLMAASNRGRNERGGGRVDSHLVEIDELDAELARQRCDKVGLADRALVDENAAKRGTARSLFSERALKVGSVDQTAIDEQPTKLIVLGRPCPSQWGASPRESCAHRAEELQQRAAVDGIVLVDDLFIVAGGWADLVEVGGHRRVSALFRFIEVFGHWRRRRT